MHVGCSHLASAAVTTGNMVSTAVTTGNMLSRTEYNLARNTPSLALSLSHTHTHTHKHTRTHAHTHTRTHAHPHPRNRRASQTTPSVLRVCWDMEFIYSDTVLPKRLSLSWTNMKSTGFYPPTLCLHCHAHSVHSTITFEAR
jgi:hypothetical protein